MPVYTIAQLKFTNVDAYRRYQKAFPAVFAKFNAKVLVADESPRVLEGDWPRDKVVILEFPDEAEAIRFQSSPEYEAIAKGRKVGADAVVIVAKGFAPPSTPKG